MHMLRVERSFRRVSQMPHIKSFPMVILVFFHEILFLCGNCLLKFMWRLWISEGHLWRAEVVKQTILTTRQFLSSETSSESVQWFMDTIFSWRNINLSILVCDCCLLEKWIVKNNFTWLIVNFVHNFLGESSVKLLKELEMISLTD